MQVWKFSSPKHTGIGRRQEKFGMLIHQQDLQGQVPPLLGKWCQFTTNRYFICCFPLEQNEACKKFTCWTSSRSTISLALLALWQQLLRLERWQVTSPTNWQWPIYGLEGVERLERITESFMQSCHGRQVEIRWRWWVKKRFSLEILEHDELNWLKVWDTLFSRKKWEKGTTMNLWHEPFFLQYGLRMSSAFGFSLLSCFKWFWPPSLRSREPRRVFQSSVDDLKRCTCWSSPSSQRPLVCTLFGWFQFGWLVGWFGLVSWFQLVGFAAVCTAFVGL